MAHSVSSSSSSSPGSASCRSASSKSNARLGVLAVPRFGLRPDGGAVRQLHLTGEPVLHPGSKPLAFGELRDLRPTRPRLGMPLRDRRLVVEPPCSRRRVPTQLTRDRRRRPGERGERSRGRRDSALGAARCPRVRRTTGIGRSRGAGRRQRRGQVDAREAAPAFLRPRHRRAHHYTLNPEEPLNRQTLGDYVTGTKITVMFGAIGPLIQPPSWIPVRILSNSVTWALLPRVTPAST
jgi:hypothetical protein